MPHPLGTLLQQEHMLKEEDLERVERVCSEFNCSFEDAVTRLELLTPDTISVFKEHLPTLALSQLTDIDPNLLDLLPPELARRYQCLPVASVGGTLTVAIADPSDTDVLQVLSDQIGRPVDAVPALEADLAQVIAQHYGQSELDAPEANPMESEAEPPALGSELAGHSVALGDRTQGRTAPSNPGTDLTEEPNSTNIIEDHPDHTRAEVVMDSTGDLPEQVALANRLVSLMAVRKADRVEVRWKGDSQSSAYLFDQEGRHGLASISPLLASKVIQRYRVLADLLMASRQRPQEGTFSLKLRYEDGTYEDMEYSIQIVPIGEAEGEVATLTMARAEAPPAPGTVDADAPPTACPSCGQIQVRSGFLYCPMCGIGVA